MTLGRISAAELEGALQTRGIQVLDLYVQDSVKLAKVTEKNLLSVLDLASKNECKEVKNCSICLMPLFIEDVVFLHKGKGFKHEHHKSCVKELIRNRCFTCPVCRKEIDNENFVEDIRRIKAITQLFRSMGGLFTLLTNRFIS